MGMTHLICVNGSALDLNKSKPAKFKEALGEVVWTLCADPQYAFSPDGVVRISSGDILNFGSAVRHADEVHSSQQEVFIWDGGFLQAMDKLSEADLKNAKLLFDDKYEEQMDRIRQQVT